MTFDRKAALPLGHRFYTSGTTLIEWGAGGTRLASNETYSSHGWEITAPPQGTVWAEYRPVRVRRVSRRPIALLPLHRRRKSPRHEGAPGAGSVICLPNDGPSADWLAERDAAGFATEYGEEGNRIERALVNEKSPLAAALRQVSELIRPPVVTANDNAPPTADANPGNEGERKHNQGSITPSVPMLLRAVADGMRPRVIRHPDGTTIRISTGHKFEGGWHLAGWNSGRKLHGIIIQDGEMSAYSNDRGRPCRPAYNADPLGLVFDKESETGRHIERQADENGTYTRLKSAGVYASAQSPNAPRSLAPAPRMARAVANDNILSSAKANTSVMPPVTKLPDGVAYEYGRLAGIAGSTGAGADRTSAPMHEVLVEMDRADKFAACGIDAADLDVIEDILSDASFRTIGLARGYAESSAHRMGRKVVEDALRKISAKLAA